MNLFLFKMFLQLLIYGKSWQTVFTFSRPLYQFKGKQKFPSLFNNNMYVGQQQFSSDQEVFHLAAQ